jgi:nucleoside-diphosphate-sugar epimerase/lipopolysaccharide/colanic/teichoic acid biosynthesis glycosyltransferase
LSNISKPFTLLTGATGFVGQAVAQALLQAGHPVVAAVRQLPAEVPQAGAGIDATGVAPIWQVVGPINAQTDWQAALQGVQTVVHCAARAHVMREHAADALAAYRELNVQGTLRLAQQAAVAGVQRFVFLSSIKVNGEGTVPSQAFTEADAPAAQDAYGQSKAEAEQALLALAAQTGMEVVIIRPPLVYGPGVKGNFAGMIKAVQRGLSLPLGAVHNQRSLVALDNLVSLVLLCADRERSPQAANQVFVVADGQDVSTTTLLRKVAQAVCCPSRLLPVPAWLLRAGATLLGKRAVADRLLGNLQVDATKARTLLGWRPVVTMEQQLAAMFAHTPATAHSMPLATRAVLRLLDVLLAGAGLLVLWPLLLVLYGLGLFDTGAPLLRQERVGRHQRPFVLVKFRTMRRDTAHVASHLANSAAITPLGAVLRRTKLDELPQLWNVLLGHMSLVGPRPGLFNQHDLTQARTAHGVYAARPGITGLAQVNGIDMSTPELLAQTDARMLRELSVRNYFKFIFLTVLGKGSGDGVKTQ